MIKNNKLSLALSSAVILLPALIGFIIRDKLPDTLNIHWNTSGVADGTGSKYFVIFCLPLIMLAFHWLCVLVTEKDPKNKNQSPKMQKIVLWIIPFISCFIMGFVYFSSLGKDFDVMGVTFILLGALFVILGNYMPKVKQNHTLGIKIKWTLENEENWNKTHRMSGFLYVVSGFVMIVAAFLPLKAAIPVMVAAMLAAVIIPVAYSYSIYRKMKKNGEISAENKPEKNKNKRTAAIISVVIPVIISVAVAGLMVVGDIDVVCNETSLEIVADFWDDLTVEYSDIDEISIRENVDGIRVWGVSSARLLMGTFENEEFGAYTRYTYSKCKTCILIKSGENILVINAENDEATNALYEEIVSKN